MAGTIKKHAGICIGLILFAVGTAGCSAGEHKDQKQAEKTYAPEESGLTYALQTETDAHRVEIPVFQSENESAAVAQLNQEIEDQLMSLYEDDKSTEKIPEIETEFYVNDQYLQAVCRYVEYPLVGGYGDVVTYNYDRIHDQQITLTDVLVTKQTTLDDVRQMVTDSCLQTAELAQTGASIYGVTVDGFVLDEEDNCAFYGNVDISMDGASPWSYVYRFGYETQTVTIYNLTDK